MNWGIVVKTRKMSIRAKLMVLISGMCIICLGVIGIVIYQRVSAMMIQQSKEDAMGLAVTAASEIDGAEFDAIDTEEDDYFQTVYDILSKYKQSGMIAYIYSMKMEDEVLQFVVDTDEEDPADFGEEYELLEDMVFAFRGEVCCDSEVTSDEWGDYYSAYAPIFDDAGNVKGIVGCDVTIDRIDVGFECKYRSCESRYFW